MTVWPALSLSLSGNRAVGCKPQGRGIFMKQSLLFYFHINMMRCKETKRNVQNLRQIPLKYYHFPEYIALDILCMKKKTVQCQNQCEMERIFLFIFVTCRPCPGGVHPNHPVPASPPQWDHPLSYRVSSALPVHHLDKRQENI